MRERYPRFFDGLFWPASVLITGCVLLNNVSTSFLAVQQFGADYAALARIATAGALVYAVGSPLAAWLGARIGMRLAATLGAVCYVVWSLLLTRAGSVDQLALCAVVSGVGSALFWPNMDAEVARGRAGPLLRRRLAVFNAMWCAGTMVGPFLGVWLYPSESVATKAAVGREAINGAFYAAGLLAAGLALLLAVGRTHIPAAGELRAEAQPEPPRQAALLGTFRTMCYVANFMCYVVLGVLRSLYEALADYQWSGQEPAARHFWLLVLLAGMSTLMFGLTYFAHRWSYRLKRHVVWQLALAGALVLVALTGSFFWSAVAFAVIGVAVAFVYSGSLFYSIEGTQASTHKAGWHEGIIGLGVACGLMLTGHMPWLLSLVGVADRPWQMRSPYVLTAALVLVGVLVQLAVYFRRAP